MKTLRVLVGCEFSGIVRDAFAALGHDAWSCDLLPSETDGQHIIGDVRDWLKGRPKHVKVPNGQTTWDGGKNDPGRQCFDYHTIPDETKPWDIGIFHPPCRVLNHAGVRWLYVDGRRWIKNREGNVIGENPRNEDRWEEMRESAAFFRLLLNAPIEHVAVENSEMHPHALELVGLKPSQSLQPWQFGHGETKETCLWLRGLPLLVPTNIVDGRKPRVHHASPGPNRWKERSRTMPGIASAMALQWSLIANPKPETKK